jgi:cytochrome c biogenesis protein CcmG/thiol:disulfide interchange protein DsbE
MKKIFQFIPFILILLITTLLFIKVNSDGNKTVDNLLNNSPMLNKDVPDITLESLFPKQPAVSPKTFKNNYTLVNLFASWCVACLAEHKLISELKSEKKLQLIGIAWRDKHDETKEWLKRNGNPYNIVAQDSMGKYGIMLGVTGIPESFLVDKNGKIIMHIRGVINEDDVLKIKDYISQK